MLGLRENVGWRDEKIVRGERKTRRESQNHPLFKGTKAVSKHDQSMGTVLTGMRKQGRKI